MKKTMALLKCGVALVATLGWSNVGQAALLAQWNFNSGTAADLTSDVGAFTFTPAGNLVTPYTLNPGAITVWGGSELVATGINSTAQTALATTATVWVRMQNNFLPTGPAVNPQFFFGLENAIAPADWDQSGMTGMYDNVSNQLGQYSNTNLGPGPFPTGGNYGTTFVTAPALDTYFTMALVLTAGQDDGGFPDPTRVRFQTFLNGVQIGAGSAAGTSVPSLSFALGTLKASGGGNYTFDEARVYDTSLTALEIAAIPEPSSVVLLMAGTAALLALRMRRRTRPSV